MKILHVISSMNPLYGGPCQGIRNFTPKIKGVSLDKEVVCLDSTDADYLEKDNFVIYTLGEAPNPWAYHKQLIPWLLDNLHRYDVIIVHGLWLYHSYAAYKAWKKYKKFHKNTPTLYVMPHGMLDPYFQKAKERKLKAIRNWLYWKLIESKVINYADGVLFTCEEELRLARESFIPYYPKKELNVGYGIQPPLSYSDKMTQTLFAKLSNWNGKPFILFLSRIHQKKGVDLLIKSYNKLQNEIQYLPQLIIAGPGLETPYGKEMQCLANVNKNILFPGMLSGESKWGAFYNCEVFVLPSHQENFGIAIVEAMACKKAVLITDKINIWREIEKENAGIVDTDTESAVYTSLKKWIGLSLQQKEVMRENAFTAYHKYFSIEKSTENFIKAIS